LWETLSLKLLGAEPRSSVDFTFSLTGNGPKKIETKKSVLRERDRLDQLGKTFRDDLVPHECDEQEEREEVAAE